MVEGEDAAALLDGFEGHCKVSAVSGPILNEEFGACIESRCEMDHVTELFQAWRTDCPSGARSLAKAFAKTEHTLERVQKIAEQESDPNQTTNSRFLWSLSLQ